MSKQEWAIEIDGLVKSYKKTEVLKGVSLKVERGTIFALLGANGAGKTTMINILTTLLRQDGGSSRVAGYDVAKHADKVRQRISLTGQFAAVDDILSGRENLELISELRHEANPRKVAMDLLTQFDLTDAADRRAMTYSGGMRRRLDIAMSLIGSPEIIFLDEPTTGLDPQSRNQMWEQIKTLADRGITIFLTTQYLEEADQLADQIAILADGKIVAEGTAEELKKLVPHNQISLRFTDADIYARARKTLMGYAVIGDDETFTVMIQLKDGVSELAKLFAKIDQARLEVAEFSQKTPSLDDVFFKIINDNKGVK